MPGMVGIENWDVSVLDGMQVLDRVDGLDDEFANIYLKSLDFIALMLGDDEYRRVEKAFLDFANAVQGGDLETKEDIAQVLWAGYHEIPGIYARLRWYGEDAKFHYQDGADPKQSSALKAELAEAQRFHDWLPGDWVSVSETGGKGLFGKVLQMAQARYALDTDQELTVDQIVVLSGLNRRSVLNAISKPGEAGLEVDPKGLISNAEAKRWLSERRNFKPTEIYRPFAEPEVSDEAVPEQSEEAAYEFVPVTDDKVAFLPDLRRAQGYQIGKYGQEEYVTDYFEALRKLQSMSTPRFRRPNVEGNWGIKVGMEWRRVPLDELRQSASMHENA